MRTFAPYSALAYDWLHDAPGVTESLRARSRTRFDAWMNYYSTSGYLRDLPGANYQAGYLFAATLMAIAEAGEAGAAGDAHWATVRDGIWGSDMQRALSPGEVLDGGDWPEGWQYGPLSVLEYSLAARAMQENGTPIPGIENWASSLVTRFAHGLTPTRMMYPAGDTDDETAHRDPVNGPLLAAIAGPANERARAWARSFDASLGLDDENPLFDALAAARLGPSEAFGPSAPTAYLAKGTGNFYARGDWTSDTAWSVFQCSRRLVDDHQHNDAGNFVLARGPDDVVFDPSPYGTLSTLTGNAPAIDSGAVPAGYSPSQGNWGDTTGLVWAKTTSSGIAVARCDYADQFRGSDVPSDVTRAVRDFVFVPDGAAGSVVLVDRAVTGNANRGMHLRVRTPATLSLTGNVASGSVGGTSLSIEKTWASSGTPSVRTLPKASECGSSDRTCDVSRLSGMEYRTDVAGPAGLAIHVVVATKSGLVAPARRMLTESGYRGVLLESANGSVAVVTNDAPDAVPPSSLVYRVPAGSNAVHIVVDAPVGDAGRSDVVARLEGADCIVTVTPHHGAVDGYDGHPLVVQTSASCATSQDTGQPSQPGGGGETGGTGGGSGGSTTAGTGGSGAISGAAGAPGGGTSLGGGSVGANAGGTKSSPDDGHAASLDGSAACSLGRARSDTAAWLVAFALAAFRLRRRDDRELARRRRSGFYRFVCAGQSLRGTRP